MAQIINIGNQSNDGTGDSIRDAFNKVNSNFAELYGVAGLAGGLYFTKLKDAPVSLLPSTATTPALLVTDYFGNTLTNKLLVAGRGVAISNTSNVITIENLFATLAGDPTPTLGGNLNAQNLYRGINFLDPISPQDLATKHYADTNSPFSRVNFYVSTFGTDTFGPDIPPEKQGRQLGYAFKTINQACQAADAIISTSTLELSSYQQNITLNNGDTTATVALSTTGLSSTRVYIDYGVYAGSDQFIQKNIKPGQYLSGDRSATVAFIEELGHTMYLGLPYEYYDVTIKSGNGFVVGEPLQFSYEIPIKHITIFVESGIYEEQLPIKVPANVSIRGDEFRRCIIRPAPGTSSSKWSKTYFRRDDNFDGLTRASRNGRTALAPLGEPYGYHYLTDANNVNSTPKLNVDMDVFLMNDAGILRAISVHGHGGFMCVLDPEGQILTKSPYIQNCSSLSRSINEQTFSGGLYVDGFSGNLQCAPVDAVTYYTGTTVISVTGLTHRNPQTPTSFYNLGNRYEVDYYVPSGLNDGAGLLELNPRSAGGIAYPGGTITVNDGSGYSYAPIVLFDQPSENGGFPAQGLANLSGGVIQSITITNPGTGYTGTVQVSFIGGNPLVAAAPITIPGTRIKTGFIGVLPEVLELGTAGNKSMLSADFTQVNDLGYGYVGVNNGVLECVSDFAYYNHAGYYAKNGANIRSLNGSCAWGDYALISEGSDPNEIPLPVYLDDDMVQTGTVVSYNFVSAGINTQNTAGSTVLYIRGYTFVPYNQSQIEVDHGYATDTTGNVLGVQTYNIVSASTVSNASLTGINNLVALNLSNANLFGSTSGGLKAPITSGTQVTLRSLDVFKFKGINPSTTYSGAPALRFLESTGTVYHILGYDSTNVESNDSKITLREDFGYVNIQTYNTSTAAGTSTIAVLNLDDPSANRILAQIGRTDTQFTFAWHGGIYRITNYQSSATISKPYAQISISPNLGSTLTNVATQSVLIKAGLRKYSYAEITRSISILRASNHDLIDIGAGSYYQSRIPSNVFGPPVNTPSVSHERVERGTGRVFATTNDQNGNFKVGDYFQVNQASGDLTIKASLNLTQVSGLGFKRGVVVSEFSQDSTMIDNAGDVVPTQSAVIGYINNRLGVNSTGGLNSTKIGPGYLDLTGVQAMIGSINMAGNKITFLSSSTIGSSKLEAVNKGYADMKISLAGVNTIDPATGVGSTSSGVMTGALQLFRDPVMTDDGSTAVTRRFVDQVKQLAALSDVNLNTPAEQHLLMFTGLTMTLNTSSSKPIWTPSPQLVNVGIDLPNSNVQFGRNGNSLTISIQTGTIWNQMISSTASIAQSKLSMQAAGTLTTSTGITQSDRGLAAFDSTFFNSVNGFISLTNSQSFPINAQTATKVDHPVIFSGSYFNQGTILNYDGTTSTTVTVYGTSTNTANTLVARDGNGNIQLGAVSGTISQADSLQVNGTGQYFTATTSTLASTIVSRDSNGNIWGKYFIGTATNAWYADLAENYQADMKYEPGTVLVFGGTTEVTISTEEQDTRIAGVVSSNPAYLMNGGLEGEHVVPVAFTGRVPTKVLGPCQKGDLMVSSNIEGVATSINNVTADLAKPGSVIGKALFALESSTVEIIEVVVGRL